jgi:hypothetical protein
VADYLKAGGVQADVKDLSSLQKGLAIATGKALPSDFAKTGAQSGATPAAPAPVATPVTRNADNNAKDGKDNEGNNEPHLSSHGTINHSS